MRPITKFLLLGYSIAGLVILPGAFSGPDVEPVRTKHVSAPVYPKHLLDAGTEGVVVVEFVVDEEGSTAMDSFKVLSSSNSAFSNAVRRAVAETTFYPARSRGRAVRQLVQQPYKFEKNIAVAVR